MAETVRVQTKHIDGLRFISKANSGVSLVMDSGKPPEGGSAPTPMELLLMALTGCTGIDMALILNRMRVPFTGLEIEALGERAEEAPKRYTRIRITYRVKGPNVPRDRVERAVELSMNTYCSVLANLRPTLDVEHTIIIEPE